MHTQKPMIGVCVARDSAPLPGAKCLPQPHRVLYHQNPSCKDPVCMAQHGLLLTQPQDALAVCGHHHLDVLLLPGLELLEDVAPVTQGDVQALLQG